MSNRRTHRSRSVPPFRKIGTRELLQSIFKEQNVNKRVERELLACFDAGKSFPYGPEIPLSKPQSEISLQSNQVLRLPSKPMQRTKTTIEQLGAYAREQFRPTPAKTRPAKEKERLQNRMAFGKDFDPEIREYIKRKSDVSYELKITPEQQFDEILMEIEERKQFLEDMEALGKEKEYFNEINYQIIQKLQELVKLDKKRGTEIINRFEYSI